MQELVIEIPASPVRVWECLLACGSPTLRQPFVRMDFPDAEIRLRANPRGTRLTVVARGDWTERLAKVVEAAKAGAFPVAGMMGSEGGATT